LLIDPAPSNADAVVYLLRSFVSWLTEQFPKTAAQFWSSSCLAWPEFCQSLPFSLKLVLSSDRFSFAGAIRTAPTDVFPPPFDHHLLVFQCLKSLTVTWQLSLSTARSFSIDDPKLLASMECGA
jgi:hypothetical protein